MKKKSGSYLCKCLTKSLLDPSIPIFSLTINLLVLQSAEINNEDEEQASKPLIISMLNQSHHQQSKS